MTEPLLSVERLSASYGPIRALTDVTISVPDNSVVALLGPNGAGKSTMVRVLTGLLRTSEGDIRFAGKSLKGLNPERIAKLGVSVAPEGRRVFPGMNVEDNLLAGGYTRRRERQGTKSRLANTYELFPKLQQRRMQLAGSLSGGEQQMLAVGRALMGSPRLLILDEPSLGLAPKIVADLYDSLAEIAGSGVTILLIEQNVEMAVKLSSYGYVLVNGRVVADAPSKSLRDIAAKAYLQVDESRDRNAV